MARRKATQPPQFVQREFTVEEIERGIAKLRRRIEEVEALQDARYDDQRVYNAQSDIRNTVLEIFGEESQEFRERGHVHIYHGSMYIGMSESESQSNFLSGIPRTIELLEGLIKRLEEKRGDLRSCFKTLIRQRVV